LVAPQGGQRHGRLDDETQFAAMGFLAGRDGVADGRQVAAREHPAARTSRAAADA
jgi:hypothetical protein